jgi:uncharacterized protein YkwD
VNVIGALFALHLGLCGSLMNEVARGPFARDDQGIRSSGSWRLELAADSPAAGPEQYSSLAHRIHQQVNAFRREHALKPLALDPLISDEARKHSAEMARIGKTISHRGFDARLENIEKRLPLRAAAENVAAAKGDSDPARTVVEGWTKSAGHRDRGPFQAGVGAHRRNR